MGDFLLHFLFPAVCVVCAKELSGVDNPICKKCLNSLVTSSEFLCAGCGSRTVNGKTCFVCLRQRSSQLDYLLTLSAYQDNTAKKMIYGFKYQFVHSLHHTFNRVIGDYLAEHFRVFQKLQSADIIVPVPLSRYRLHWRGYNQAGCIAKIISKYTQKPVKFLLNRKDFFVFPQAQISNKIARQQNVRGKFQLQDDANISISGRTLLLVDDVYTTGATMNECARVLKQARAGQVWGFAFARG